MLTNAASGIAGAVVLGLGRVLGETMAVTMVIGNSPQITASLFEPAYTIASVLAANFADATDELYLSGWSRWAWFCFWLRLSSTPLQSFSS